MQTFRTFTLAIFILSVILTVTLNSASAQTLLEKKFKAETESEALLDLTASSPGTSWGKSGSEAATAAIFVDNRKHQDLILFAGMQNFTYRLMLGRVEAGEHSLRIEFNRAQSAARAVTINIADAKIALLDRHHPEFKAISYAPILYARPDTIGQFSDVPLLMYYETLREGEVTTLRYTVIFSNEDGGTQTAALMARWGRTTDIEWIVDVQFDSKGKVIGSTYQGIKHETKTFQGKREADHPLFLTESDNNNFSDSVPADSLSSMRFALRPIAVDLSNHSREWVMDQHPWTYTVMAEEMAREGKITTERTLGARISDLRNYLYLDAASNQQNGAVISFAVKLKGNAKWYTSDFGINSYKIDRSGHFRTTIRLPKGTTLRQIERLAARCDLTGNPRSKEEITKAAAAQCELNSVNKIFLLNESFQPAATLPVRANSIKMPFGEAVDFPVGSAN